MRVWRKLRVGVLYLSMFPCHNHCTVSQRVESDFIVCHDTIAGCSALAAHQCQYCRCAVAMHSCWMLLDICRADMPCDAGWLVPSGVPLSTDPRVLLLRPPLFPIDLFAPPYNRPTTLPASSPLILPIPSNSLILLSPLLLPS